MAHLEQRNHEEGPDVPGGLARSQQDRSNGFAGPPSSHGGVKEQVEWALDLFQRRKWLIVLTCLLAIAAAAAYTYTQTPLYRASSLVLIEQKEEGQFASTMSGAESASRSNELLAGNGRSLQNELVVLRNSRSLRQRVAQRLLDRGVARRLLESTTQSPIGQLSDQLGAAVGQYFGGESGPKTEEGQDSSSSADRETLSVPMVASALRGHVRFSSGREGTNVIRMTASDEDPELARLLANVYMEEYIELTREASRARVSASRAFLQKRAQELEQDLEAIEQDIQAFQRREDAVSLDQRESSLANRIADAESELEQARIELRMEETSLESLRQELDSIRPEQLSQQVGSTVKQEIEALESKIAELELSRQHLMLESGPTSPADSAQAAQIGRRIRDLRSRLSNLSDKMVDQLMAGGLNAEEGARRVNTLKRQIAEKQIRITGLEARINVLSDRLEEYRSQLDSIPQKSMVLAQLQRDRKYAEQMYGFVTQQLQRVRVREKSEVGYATSMAEASLPGAPIRPTPRRNLFLGLILGLLGGVGLAMFRDRLDNRFYKPDRLGEMGYHEAGVIPNLTPLIQDRLDGRATQERNGRQLETSLVSVVEPHSAAAESYRSVRMNLQLGRSDSRKKTVLVTSPGSGDGKSVTAANLAIVMAQAGESTLLIDADLRRPRLHDVFDVSRTPGLTEALQNDLQEHVMKRPSVDNLYVLPAGRRVENPSEIFASSQFREFLQRARQYFDSVILDSPPVLAATDAPLLSNQCDTTLCVVRAGTTTESELERAMEILGDVNANVAGVVFNGFDVSMAYGYKYRYRHYGQYGPYDQYRSLPEATA